MQEKDQSDIANFLHNVALLREERGLSRRTMAKLLGISPATLVKMEAGILPPRLSVEVIFRVWKFFAMPPGEQFRRRED